MPDLHSLPTGCWPEHAIRNNGPDNLALERYKLRELAEGWPCYRYPTPNEKLIPGILANGRISNLFSMRGRSYIQHGQDALQSKIS
jgi:hypothetical protein